jgi:hypothetical protein
MTNYSYLKRVILPDTKINYEKLKKELEEIEKSGKDDGYLCCLTDNYNWFDSKNPLPNITNFNEYSNRLDDKALCGYLTPSTIKKLCKSGLCMENNNENNPIMYFDEEGWDRLHYFKFFPGTEKVEHGTYAFNFNSEFYENKFIDELNISSKCVPCTSKTKDDIENEKYEYINNIRENYIQNLIFDSNTAWRKYILDYNKNEKISDLDIIMTLSGVRSEDMEKDPEKFTKIMKDLWTKKA